MIKHILKLLWNKRKFYVWIFAELILVFVILFYCLVQTGVKLTYYMDPSNLNTENVFSVWGQPNKEYLDGLADRSEYWDKYDHVINKLKRSEYVEVIHEGAQTQPENTVAVNYWRDSLTANGNKVLFFPKFSDANFQRVFRFDMIDGKWFEDKQLPDGTFPVVLTETLVKDLGYTSSPMGAKINYKKRDFTVMGVMHDYKSYMFDQSVPSAIFAKSAFGEKDLGDIYEMYLVKKGKEDDFVNFFWTELSRELPPGSIYPAIFNLEASTMDSKLDNFMQLLVIFIPTLFLIVFAFIGTYALNARQMKKSTGEYGLRMAMGSSGKGLRALIVNQNLTLITLALIVGAGIALNLYYVVFQDIEKSIIISSLIVSAAIMFAFSLVTIWYPAHRISHLHPSEALRQQE